MARLRVTSVRSGRDWLDLTTSQVPGPQLRPAKDRVLGVSLGQDRPIDGRKGDRMPAFQ